VDELTQDRTIPLPGGGAMPIVGFGTWALTGRRGYEAIRTALEAGYRHLDTATAYGNEAEVGRAIRDSGVDREDVFVTTKLPAERAGRARETLDRSLRDLGVDHVDLWLVHWPPGGRAAPDTWRELVAAHHGGLARAIGVSNYSTAQLDELIGATGEVPSVNQIPWGPSRHDPARLAEHRERGVVVEGYSPIKNADLRNPALRAAADAHGVTSAQVVVRWHVQHGIVVIPKSATPERIRSNGDVFGFALTDAEMAAIDATAGG
jgi:diketogulonate reductase-like aldo/keto reductase